MIEIIVVAFLLLVIFMAMDSGDAEIDLMMRHMEEIRKAEDTKE